MRYLFALLIIIALSPAQKAFAAYDSVTASNCLRISVLEQPVLLKDLSMQHPLSIASYPRQGFRGRRDPNRAATGLLIGGIICTAVGIPLIIIGAHDYEPDGRYNTMPLLEMLAGALVGSAGITLTISGGVIKIRNRDN